MVDTELKESNAKKLAIEYAQERKRLKQELSELQTEVLLQIRKDMIVVHQFEFLVQL